MRPFVLLILASALAASSPAQEPLPTATPDHSPEVSSLTPEAIQDFDKNPPAIQKLLRDALDLTARQLRYLYDSADPERGGMDCSGTIYYLLQKQGITNAPRTSSDQYVWTRKADQFEAVLSKRKDSFELEDLRPGDLLFWSGTYSVERDPPVTHTMIYLGQAKSDGAMLMVGASEGRTFRGKKQYGVSVFDFVIPQKGADAGSPRFVGYASIPGFETATGEPGM